LDGYFVVVVVDDAGVPSIVQRVDVSAASVQDEVQVGPVSEVSGGHRLLLAVSTAVKEYSGCCPAIYRAAYGKMRDAQLIRQNTSM
jgi:hypothetical protein